MSVDPHRLAAARLVGQAALHIGATDDRYTYWHLLAKAEQLLGRHDLQKIYVQASVEARGEAAFPSEGA